MKFDSQDNLQVSEVRSSQDGTLFLRGYGKSHVNSTITDRTYILSGKDNSYSLVRTIEDEITAIEIMEDNTLIAVGIFGNVYVYNSNGWTNKNFKISPVKALSRTLIFQNNLYIIGTGMTFITLTNNGWIPVCQPLSQSYDLDLYGLCSKQAGEFVVCGEKGFAAKVTPAGYQKLNIPTNVDLNNIACVNSEEVVVCGDNGIIFVGYDDKWTDYSRTDLGVNFTSIVYWREEVYISAQDSVFKLGRDGLELFANVQSFNLIGLQDEMWSIGINQMAKYDGSVWIDQRIVFDEP